MGYFGPDADGLCVGPDGIHWPRRDNGRPSFTLVDLAIANGIEHTSAHDALSDIEANDWPARLVKLAQPKLSTFFALRQKQAVINQLYPLGKAPCPCGALLSTRETRADRHIAADCTPSLFEHRGLLGSHGATSGF